jgi:hypothetical protein
MKQNASVLIQFYPCPVAINLFIPTAYSTSYF